jgi:hypothetical protein
MKLTKGKLSKLFHKKKQTMRRYKNQRKYRRASKTFRQRKPLNLHRSSMKKMVDPRKIEWIGGTDPEEKVPLVVKPASDETPSQEKITTFTLGSDEPPQVDTPGPVPTTESTTEQVSAPTTESEEVSAPAPTTESEQAPAPTTESEQAPATTTESEQVSASIPESEQAPAPAEVPVDTMESTQADTIPAQDVPKQMDAENPKSDSSSVADALNLIADKIATAVVNKMRENSTSGSSPNQDADIAVPLAVNAVVKQTQLAPE